MQALKKLLFAPLALAMFACNSVCDSDYDTTTAIAYSTDKLESIIDDLKIIDSEEMNYSIVPWHILKDSTTWQCQPVARENWTCGFWAGCMWYDFLLKEHRSNEVNNNSELQKLAEKYTLALDTLTRMPIYDHDLGFEIYCSYGKAWEITQDMCYKDGIIRAADRICELFNPTVGTILSWPRNVEMFGGHNTIMDNLINLETLFAASRLSGNAKYRDIAVKHAETTMKNHFRPDFTSYHVAVYDTISGKLKYACTHQGVADSSMWARGQSWAIYGYTMIYRETKDERFLDWAQKVTDVYLERLPEDGIPYWDFNDPKIPETYRDVSAACVVASALIELSQYTDKKKSEHYISMAEKMLKSLETEQYQSRSTNSAILLHSVGNMPAGTEIDASIIYAEYYYLEALYRYATLIVKKG